MFTEKKEREREKVDTFKIRALRLTGSLICL
jgi:hypothetical protein